MSAEICIDPHVSAEICINMHVSAKICISPHMSTEICINLYLSAEICINLQSVPVIVKSFVDMSDMLTRVKQYYCRTIYAGHFTQFSVILPQNFHSNNICHYVPYWNIIVDTYLDPKT